MKAFPLTSPRDLSKPADNKVNPLERGMDLRDYFAAKAMQGLLSSLGEWSTGLPSHDFSESLAGDAFWIADEMMKAREATGYVPEIKAPAEEPKPAKKVSKKND